MTAREEGYVITIYCKFCDSPVLKSKKGNLYCSNICWEKEPYKTQRMQNRLENEAIMEAEHGDWGDRD